MPEQSNCRILLLAGKGTSTRIVCNALKNNFGSVRTLIEDPVSRTRFLRGRLRRLGLGTVLGQLAFLALVRPVLQWEGRDRIREIKQEFSLDDSRITGSVIRIASVNSRQARDTIRALDPTVVVVNGTRIIDSETLAAIGGSVINTHAGITPLYRGVHGGYWALIERRPDLAGSTVHFVDEGVDTGRVIDQATFAISEKDSFVTYPYLHLAVGIPPLVNAVRSLLAGTLHRAGNEPALPSRLRTHPTLLQYVFGRFRKGVK